MKTLTFIVVLLLATPALADWSAQIVFPASGYAWVPAWAKPNLPQSPTAFTIGPVRAWRDCAYLYQFMVSSLWCSNDMSTGCEERSPHLDVEPPAIFAPSTWQPPKDWTIYNCSTAAARAKAMRHR